MTGAACLVTSAGCSDPAVATSDDAGSSDSAAQTAPATVSDSSTSVGATTDPTADSSSSDDAGSSGETTQGTETSSESGGTTTAASAESDSSSDGGQPVTLCPVGDLGAVLPTTELENTINEADDFAGSCAGAGGAPDLEYTFTAPAAGPYTFDTVGSTFDTVLYVLDGECAGAELGCNDDGDGPQSVLAVELVEGQLVTVVVDGNTANGSPFSLRARAGSFVCPLDDLGSVVPADVAGDTAGLYRSHSSSCGGGAGRDAGYLFTAPQAGTYTFDTFGSSFASIITVRDGACDGAELACGYDGMLLDLAADQTVAVIVDSAFGSGPFDLHIDTLGGACPDGDLGNGVPQSVAGNTSDGDNTDAASCGGEFSPDDLYTFTAPQDGLYSFDTFGSALDTVVYLRDGGCDGTELDCNDDFSGAVTQSRVVEGLTGGQTVLIGVDGNGSGAYGLNVDLVPCPDDAASQVVPQDLGGSTQDQIDKLHGSCSAGGPNDESPDYAISFTAPSDGEYTFDTFGSAYDTLLYVVEGAACNGAERACSDNYPGVETSALSLQLGAGETITVVVDGNFGSQGAFNLHVGQLGGGLCPDADLGSAIPNGTSGDTSDGDNTVAGTCGGFTQADDTYLFTATQDGLYTFDTLGATYDTVLFVRDGDCDGVELGCNDDYSFFEQSQVAVTLAAGQTVMVAVDGGTQSGTYDLAIDFVTCPDEDLDSNLPEAVVGDTIGAVDKLAMVGCFNVDEAAPDYVFEWTAPADALYTFDLGGSDYDTVMYVQEAACGGAELACNDDSIGLQSSVSLNLDQDQTVVVVVSGYSGDSGNFALAIN